MDDKSEIKRLVREVLERGYLMSLATADGGGVWACDVIYVHDDDLNLYWMSDPDVRHSKAVSGGTRVAGTITVSGRGEPNLGIQFEGAAAKSEGPRFDLALKHFTKRGRPLPAEGDDVLEGDFWYAVRPSSIELIHEELFGFEKRKL